MQAGAEQEGGSTLRTPCKVCFQQLKNALLIPNPDASPHTFDPPCRHSSLQPQVLEDAVQQLSAQLVEKGTPINSLETLVSP